MPINMFPQRLLIYTMKWRHICFPLIMLSAFIHFSCAIMEELSPENVREFTCGKLYYRTFHLDEERDALYVGAMNRVYRLNLRNISLSGCEKNHLLLEPTESDVRDCISKGKTQRFECRNHIRVIQSMENGNRLYICGTNAHSPKDYVLYSNLTHLPRSEYVPGIGLGIAKCPYDPQDN